VTPHSFNSNANRYFVSGYWQFGRISGGAALGCENSYFNMFVIDGVLVKGWQCARFT
jgi:hypothetical protein